MYLLCKMKFIEVFAALPNIFDVVEVLKKMCLRFDSKTE